MTFEEKIAKLNEHFFYREFTYSKNTFRPSPRVEAELADNILWLDDVLVVFQLKERSSVNSTTADKEANWFKRKVLKRGTRQIRDTLDYLRSHHEIELENHRGHRFRLRNSDINRIHKVVCYSANEKFSGEFRSKRSHQSKTAGIIHVIPSEDYLGIVASLLTPTELFEYLAFREYLIDRWGSKINEVPEPALVGQYLCGDEYSLPSVDFVEYLKNLEHRIDEWDMSGVIGQFSDRITTSYSRDDYYGILAELAKLKRNELRVFKERLQLSFRKSRLGEFVQPYRFVSMRTNCGYLFVPLEGKFVERRRIGLQNLTFACKYDLKLRKCIGISIAPDARGWFSVEWCYMESSWAYDKEIEEQLQENYPFRNVRVAEGERYNFSELEEE